MYSEINSVLHDTMTIAAEQATATPYMIYIGFGAAIVCFLLGIFLTVKKGIVRGHRWPGIACMALGCASVISNLFQYFAL